MTMAFSLPGRPQGNNAITKTIEPRKTEPVSLYPRQRKSVTSPTYAVDAQTILRTCMYAEGMMMMIVAWAREREREEEEEEWKWICVM